MEFKGDSEPIERERSRVRSTRAQPGPGWFPRRRQRRDLVAAALGHRFGRSVARRRVGWIDELNGEFPVLVGVGLGLRF